jgi:hypothetical protein
MGILGKTNIFCDCNFFFDFKEKRIFTFYFFLVCLETKTIKKKSLNLFS